MTTQVTATYENGVLKPDRPLPLAERARVTVTVEPLAEEWTPENGCGTWAQLKAWILANPMHGLGPRLTRDELHERR